ncbi:MAG: class I SAM-dependent methyltransferase [Desulfovibrio sp.]|jgi:O-methyltransferase involved in polyketide biosynthesis|nr:class I SAM-dependent methyltransferase [Desulfovibrio sp.]
MHGGRGVTAGALFPRQALAALTPVERTAWHDASARALAGRWRGDFRDPPAEHLLEALGGADHLPALHPAVAPCVVARARILDAMLLDALRGAEHAEVWHLGAGFDARWHRLGPHHPDMPAKVAWHEVDTPRVLALKEELLRDSPFAGAYASVVRHGVPDMPDMPNMKVMAEIARIMPQGEPGVRRIVVLEGLLDLLPAHVKHGLLGALRHAMPGGVVLLDALDAAGAAFDNRRPERFTGHPALRVHGISDDAGLFFLDAGWAVTRSHAIMKRVPAMVCARFGLPAVLARVPLPAAMTAHYRCYALRPAHDLARGLAHVPALDMQGGERPPCGEGFVR